MDNLGNNQPGMDNQDEKTVPMQSGNDPYSTLYGEKQNQEAIEIDYFGKNKESSRKTAVLIISVVAALLLIVSGVYYRVKKGIIIFPVVPTTSGDETNAIFTQEATRVSQYSPNSIAEREVLVQNSDMTVYIPDGLARARTQKNKDVLRSEGAMGSSAQITYDEWNGAAYDAEYYAVSFATTIEEPYNKTIYTRAVNGLVFSCVDYDFGLGFYYTALYHISDGHLVKIVVGSTYKGNIWSMIEDSISPAY